MIHSLHLRNFKGIRRADVEFERLTVIVGPNASGKTSFLEALDILGEVGCNAPSLIFQNYRDLAYLYSRNASGPGMELLYLGSEANLRLRVLPPPDESESLIRRIKPGSKWEFSVEVQEPAAESQDWRPFGEFDPLGDRYLDFAILLRLDPSQLASSSGGSSTRMSSNGRGMAAALAFMALNQPDEFQVIQQRLKSVVSSIERIRFDAASHKKKDFLGYQILFDFQGAQGIPAHQASEGTILVLGLLTALMSNPDLKLVLLDDLDRGLHPKAQRKVIDLLRLVLEQDPDLQIVATTHSPYLVDCLRPEEVRLTTLGDDGAVSIASLVEHPDFDKWKDEMAPGEMWSLFGEKWVGELLRDSVEK